MKSMGQTGKLALLCLGILSSHAASAYSEAELNMQLELLVDWWTGEFDNNEQVVRQSGGGLSPPADEPHFRIHGHYLPVQIPDIGEHVLYVEEYKNDDPDNLYRIRLMSLRIDSAENGIRIDLHGRRDQQSLAGSHARLEEIAESGAASWRAFSDDCAIFLRFEGNQFVGGMRPRRCRVATERGSEEKDGYFDYKIIVGENYYWFDDRIRRLDDESVTWELAPETDDLFQLDKARWFACTVNYNLDGDMTATELLTKVRLHDQGGVAPIDYPGGRNLSLVLHNRAFTTPTANRFRILRVHEDGDPVPLSYSYALVAAERFGINLGWFYTLCGPDTPTQ